MTKDQLRKKKIPDAPGVYFFLGKRKEILYIGKATSLRNRVRSYFAPDIREKRSELIEKMILDSVSLEFTKTDSVLEALILEANLIRTHKPRANSIQKDDKSFNHLVITNEEFPRVLVVRGKDLTERFSEKDIKRSFGPFPNGLQFREALKIVRKIFRFYDTNRPVREMNTKMAKGTVNFNRQIGLYPSENAQEEYKKTIRHICLLFDGKKKQLLKEIEKEMMVYAKGEQFELAEVWKRRLFALKHIQDVALIKESMRAHRDDRSVRIEAYDVAHLGGSDMVGVMTVVESGEVKKSDYRKFKIKSVGGSNDPAALKEILDRRLGHPEWSFPQIIVVDGGTAQKNAAEHILRKYDVLIPVVAVVKDEHHRPKRIIAPRKLLDQYENDILLANAEAHRFSIAFHRDKRSKATFK